MRKIIWHLPYGMIGGVETLYATILKFIRKDSTIEHYVTCHQNIYAWVQSKYHGYAKVFPFTDQISLRNAIKTISPSLIMGTHGLTLYQALEGLDKYPVVEIVHGSHCWCEHNIYMPKDWTEHVVCVSKSAERNYLNNSNFNIQTSVIINGVDTSVFYPRKAFQRVPRNIGYFGRFLEGDKHLTKMITAFKALGNQHATLFLIGGNPVEIATLKRFAQREKIAKALRFYGHAKNPEKFYEELDMCTVRSEAEGYCNSAAESLACGTPLVCYNFGGILEHVKPGTIAVANSQSEYAAALFNVFTNHELRLTMRERGLKFIQEEGNAQIMANSYYKLITQYLSTQTFPKEVKSSRKKEVMELPYVGSVTVQGKTPGNIVAVFTPYWHGIATATKAITDKHVFWEQNVNHLVGKILKTNPDAVLFSGFPGGFKEAAKLLRKRAPKLPIYVYYHGGYSHFSFSGGLFGQGERQALSDIIELTESKVLNKIAVSSPGMAEVGRANGYPMYFCGNMVPPKPEIQTTPLPGIHIGNWNRHHDHKHTSIGIAASNLLKDSKIHMLECSYRVPSLDYSNVCFYKEMSQIELYQHYRRMTVNLQLSFIETFNISVLEMWACGAPVIVGPGSKVLVEGNDFLMEHCYLDDHTNPDALAKKILLFSNNRIKIVSEIGKWLKHLNSISRERWDNFFKGGL